MNKELKKQVIYHGNQINALWDSVHKIEDVVIRKEYNIYPICPNCCRSQRLTVLVGQKRPDKYICNNCKCEVEPTQFG